MWSVRLGFREADLDENLRAHNQVKLYRVVERMGKKRISKSVIPSSLTDFNYVNMAEDL